MVPAKAADGRKMRAVVVEKPGSVDVMRLRDDLPVPKPKSSDVRIRVAYAGLNFFDVLQVDMLQQTLLFFPIWIE